MQLAGQDVKVMIIRLPPTVHGKGNTKFGCARGSGGGQRGSAYREADNGIWSAVHVKDAARLYVLAPEKGKAGRRYHAVAERGIKVKDIAETIAVGLKVEARAVKEAELEGYVGFLAPFLKTDYTAEAEITKRELGWEPEESGLLDDIRDGGYLSQ
jgi:nucleoside-diphosphate-sugar epimerase